MGNSKPFFVQKLEGVGAAETSFQTQKSPYQDGESYFGNTLDARTLTIEGVIFERNRNLVFKHRKNLIDVFNPKLGPLTLTFEYDGGAKKIECIPDGAPVFPDNQEDPFQRFLISLYCPNPYWQELSAYRQDLAIWVGDFSFPLEIQEATGIELGHRESSLIANIFNQGDVSCGMEIRFTSLATVVNPSLFDVNRREFIKVNRTMQAGERLVITTHFGRKRMELITSNGETTNAFNYVDPDSTFLQLYPGDNVFRYDAEEGIENLEVSIYYTPLYLGV